MSERERFERLEAAFDQALDLDTQDRAALLEKLRDEDPQLADELEALLRATEDSHSFLDHAPAATDDPDPVATLPPGERMGPWRLLKPIGQGGMGSVFLAERADGAFDKKVALKLLRGGHAGLARAFALERRALARLDHPGIARLLDAGVDPQGRPFLAMEWVDGEEVRAWCRHHDASLERRLELFLDICAAVAYAHRNLVVHRDIKPRNILVDADGRPKLLDFGIAKLIDPDGGETTTIAAMTPDYAAPEQLSGEAITTRTDVYALGALLHTLLCGAPPLPTSGLSLAEIIHRVCQQTPPSPSACAIAQGDQAPVPAARLRGDLDAIVARALSKEPDRRYGSVDAFADDVRRFLDSRPVVARRPTLVYRLTRFLRRHSLATGASLLVLAGIAFAAVQFERQSSEARQAREVTVIESERATAVRDFLQVLVRDVDDETRLNTRELLERASADIDTLYSDRPQMRVQFLLALTSLYLLRNDYVAVDSTLERLFAGDLEGVPPQLVAEAHCDRAHARVRQGHAEDARGNLDQAFRLLQGLPNEIADMSRADCLMIESQVLRLEGATHESLAPMQQALAIRLRREPEDSVDIGIVRTNLGAVHYALGRYAQAREEYLRALHILERRGRSQTADAANLLNNLAATAFAKGDLREAEQLFEQAIDLRRRLLGQSAALGALLNNRARLLVVLDRAEEALPLAQDAVEMQTRFTGEDSVETALMLAGRAEIEMALGDLDAAAATIERSLDNLRARLGEAHVLVQRSRAIELRIAGTRIDPAAAAAELEALQDAIGERTPMADSILATALVHAAMLQLSAGQAADAERAARSALALRAAQSDDHWEKATARRVLAEALLGQGQGEAANRELEIALPVLSQVLGNDHPDVKHAIGLRDRASGEPKEP